MAPINRILTLIVVLSLLLTGASVAVAQDPDGPDLAYPGYLQRGSCEQPGEPIAALAETSTGADDDAEMPGDGLGGGVSPGLGVLPAAVSVTEIEVPLDDLLGDDLIVRIAVSADDPETDVACGVVSGRADGDGNIYAGLAATNDSGTWGIAWLRSEDEVTTVTLFLIPVDPVDDAGPNDTAD